MRSPREGKCSQEVPLGKGEVLAYLGNIQNLKERKDQMKLAQHVGASFTHRELCAVTLVLVRVGLEGLLGPEPSAPQEQSRWGGNHQHPDVNFVQVLEKVDFPCTVNAQRVPFKGNQLRAETG